MEEIPRPSEKRTEIRRPYRQMTPTPTEKSPVAFELLTNPENRRIQSLALDSDLPRGPLNQQDDAGTILAPGALAALHAHLQSNGQTQIDQISSHKNPVLQKVGQTTGFCQDQFPGHSMSEMKHPVLMTNTGPYLVGPSPALAPVPQIPRTLGQRPGSKAPIDPVLFTTSERRISLQAPVPATVWVQSTTGQYQILGARNEGLDPRRILESRMLPIEITPPQNHTIPQPNATILQKQDCVPVLSQKLQTEKMPHQELNQSLKEGPPLPIPLPSNSKTLVAAVEDLKNQFLAGEAKTPSRGEGLSRGLQSTHKRRKTSTGIPHGPSSPRVPLPGLDLLFHAAELAGDDLPREQDFTGGAPVDFDGIWSRFGAILGSFVGVYPLLDGSFIARCRYHGSYIQIGSFQSAEHAARAYDRAVLSLRGKKKKTRTNYPSTEYLSFELENARGAFERKCRQSTQTRRGSTWPWARAAQTLLANDETDAFLNNPCHDGVRNVPDLTTLTAVQSGDSVFKLLQDVILKRRDLDGTFDLIQIKIRDFQRRIQSGLSTEQECDCVGQYACVASILSNLISMQRDWEKHPSETAILDPVSVSKTDLDQVPLTDHFHRIGPPLGETRELGTNQPGLGDTCLDFPDMSLPSIPHVMTGETGVGPSVAPVRDEHLEEAVGSGRRVDCVNCPYIESIRWVRLLASSLWPRKRGGGMLWKAYQPLFKSSHHRNSILKLREELFMKPSPDPLAEPQNEQNKT